MKNEKLRIAIVHDWFVGGGAEKVVQELHHMFPEAPIYTSYCTNEWREKLDGKVVTGYLQNWPFPILRKYIPFLRGWWFSHLNLRDYDLVISSSGAEAKFIRVDRTNYQLPTTSYRLNMRRPLHISYVHAPTHYYWSRYDEYLKHPGFGFFDPLARLGLRVLVGPMRRWDFRAAQRPDYLIANSNYTKNQIKKYYGRDSTVIHPPVDTERFQQDKSYKLKAKSSRHGFVVAGRQTPYKRIDLAVAACTKLNLPLTVIGNGPEHKKLMAMAGPNVTFLTKVTDEEMSAHFQKAEAFIFPSVDDFGIVAVEALAAGTPVIAYQDGGALDYVNKTSGLLFREQTVGGLAKAIEKFSKLSFNHSLITKQAEKFSAKAFKDNFQQFLKSIN